MGTNQVGPPHLLRVRVPATHGDAVSAPVCSECGLPYIGAEFFGWMHPFCGGPLVKVAAETAALQAEVDRLRGALQDIARAHPSECDQCPYWAQEALGEDPWGKP